MQSLTGPLSLLVDDTAWFARATELRDHLVEVSGELRKGALRIVLQSEFHADNRSSWILIEDRPGEQDTTWDHRSEILCAEWDRRRVAFANEGVNLEEVSLSSRVGREGFGRVAAKVAAALRPPLQGVVLILAPLRVSDPAAWLDDLEHLRALPDLAAVRWVVLQDHGVAEKAGARERPFSIHTPLNVDEARRDEDLDALLTTSAATFGQAGPRNTEPPIRKGRPSAPTAEHLVQRDDLLRRAGLSPELLGEPGQAIRDRVLRASLEMRRGEADAAISLQSEACEICTSIGLHDAETICRIALASYLSAAIRRGEALRELQRATTTAESQGRHAAAAQASLAAALLHTLDDQANDADQSYVLAAQLSARADMPMLEIESYRMAGQLALNEGLEQRAQDRFEAALHAAVSAGTKTASQTGAAGAARSLAALLREKGQNMTARSLESQASMWDQTSLRKQEG